VHAIESFQLNDHVKYWRELERQSVNDIYKQYWINMRKMAESGRFTFIGHLDVPKKYNFHPTVDLSHEINSALDAIANAGMSIELNTAGWDHPCQEAYPSKELIQKCCSRDIPIIINDDAHSADQLGRYFSRTEDYLSNSEQSIK